MVAFLGTAFIYRANADVRHFETKIRPLLVRHCAECHDPDDSEGGLVLTTVEGLNAGGRTGSILTPGEPENSRLIQAVRYTTKLKMPPDGRLPQRVIDTLAEWVGSGASMPAGAAASSERVPDKPNRSDASHWAFQPIANPNPPRITRNDWARNEIDHFIFARLESAGLQPSPSAERSTLIRRLSFNLRGLPPTPHEVQQFVTDSDPNAFFRLIERFLASPQYGERWGRHWLDVARYADSNGGGFDYVYPNAYHYRDYVIRAFNDDRPYDEFLIEQLAGDLLPQHSDPNIHLERLKATGFLTVVPKNIGEQDKELMTMNVVDDEIDVVGRSLMGLTLACARCHDHKFDPIPTRDYYALAGIFRSTALVKDTNKNPSYWPEQTLDHPRLQAEREAWQKQYDAANNRITEIVEKANADLPPQNGIPAPVAHWSFDDVTGKSSFFANATDRKSKPVFADGRFRRSVQFSGDRDIVKADPAGHRDLGFGKKTDFSISLWLKAARGYRPRTADSILSIRHESKALWFIALRPGSYNGVYLRHYNGKGSVDIKPAASQLTKLTDGGWHHLAFISDRDGLGTVFVDGEKVGSTDIKGASSQADFSKPTEIHIGASVNAFRGNLDDLAIWNRILEAKDVQQIYREGKNEQQSVADIAVDVEELYPVAVKEQLARIRAKADDLSLRKPPVPQVAMVALDNKAPANLKIHIAGNHKHLGMVARRGFPTVVKGPLGRNLTGESSGRVELARWLVDPKHPLTARVIVNRIWQHHFGDGLVRTPDNFGWLGERPSHPELLDWLAGRFIADGWSVKNLHRLILSSATWQQSTKMNPASHEIDSGNRLLWRMNRRRLEAEPIRDAVLFLSGELDAKMFGTFQTWKAKVATVDDKNKKTARYDTSRRSIYLPIVRDALHPMLALFDFGDPNSIVPVRTTTTGAPQALFMMNSEFVRGHASKMAERLTTQLQSSSERIEAAYERCFSRQPSTIERQRAQDFLRQAQDQNRAWTQLCQGLMSMNEFIHVN